MKINVDICAGTHCTMMGALNLGVMLEDIKDEMESDIDIDVKYVECLDNCHEEGAPMVKVNGEPVHSASGEKVFKKIMDIVKRNRGVVNE